MTNFRAAENRPRHYTYRRCGDVFGFRAPKVGHGYEDQLCHGRWPPWGRSRIRLPTEARNMGWARLSWGRRVRHGSQTPGSGRWPVEQRLPPSRPGAEGFAGQFRRVGRCSGIGILRKKDRLGLVSGPTKGSAAQNGWGLRVGEGGGRGVRGAAPGAWEWVSLASKKRPAWDVPCAVRGGPQDV